MQLYINFALLPHGFEVWHGGNKIYEQEIKNLRASGQTLWQAIADGVIDLHPSTTIYALTGPGSFASLRVCGTLITAMQHRYPNIKLHTIRWDQLVRTKVGKEGVIVLNGFGDRVFYNMPDSGDLQWGFVAEMGKVLKNQTVLMVDQIPNSKRDQMNQMALSVVDLEKSPLKLMHDEAQSISMVDRFVPAYEFPAV